MSEEQKKTGGAATESEGDESTTRPGASSAEEPADDTQSEDDVRGHVAMPGNRDGGTLVDGQEETPDDDEGELFEFDSSSETTSSLDDEVRAALRPFEEEDLVRRRGFVAGWLIAWPFLLTTLAACIIAVVLQWQERPQLVPFTLGLYLCMGFFAHAYSLAWRMEAHVRQFLALLATVVVLLVLSALHLDDATDRWVYRSGARVLREQRPLLFISAALDAFAALVIVAHGLGLGLGNRFFRRESGERIEYYELKRILREIEERERADAAQRADDDAN